MSFRASKRGHVLSTVEHKVLLTLDGLKPLLTRVNGLPTESVSPTLSLRQLGSLARVLAVLRAVYASSSQLTPIMKRDVYYSNALVLSNQAKADRILNQFTSQLSISLPECFVRPAPRGMLFGPIEWLEAGELVSAALEVQMIPASPPFRCDRLSAIVIVEKESIFAEFVDSRLFSGLHCLFITAKGYPNFQTLNFLHIVSKQVIAPIFVLTDADPFGLDVYACFRRGSAVNGFKDLPNCHWIGIKLEDVPEEHHIPLTNADRRTGKRLWEEFSGSNCPDSALLLRQLELMAKLGCKAEMEALIGSNWSGPILEAKLLQQMKSAGLPWTSKRALS